MVEGTKDAQRGRRTHGRRSIPSRVPLKRKIAEGVGLLTRYQSKKFGEAIGSEFEPSEFEPNFSIFPEPTQFT